MKIARWMRSVKHTTFYKIKAQQHPCYDGPLVPYVHDSIADEIGWLEALGLGLLHFDHVSVQAPNPVGVCDYLCTHSPLGGFLLPVVSVAGEVLACSQRDGLSGTHRLLQWPSRWMGQSCKGTANWREAQACGSPWEVFRKWGLTRLIFTTAMLLCQARAKSQQLIGKSICSMWMFQTDQY